MLVRYAVRTIPRVHPIIAKRRNAHSSGLRIPRFGLRYISYYPAVSRIPRVNAELWLEPKICHDECNMVLE
jgi:hypothetical protein